MLDLVRSRDVKGQHCLAEDTDFQVCQLIEAVKGVPTQDMPVPLKVHLKGVSAQ